MWNVLHVWCALDIKMLNLSVSEEINQLKSRTLTYTVYVTLCEWSVSAVGVMDSLFDKIKVLLTGAPWAPRAPLGPVTPVGPWKKEAQLIMMIYTLWSFVKTQKCDLGHIDLVPGLYSNSSQILTTGPGAPDGPWGPGAPPSPFCPPSPTSPLAPGWPSAPWMLQTEQRYWQIIDE